MTEHRSPVLHAEGLSKRYRRGDVVHALREVTLRVNPGEFVGIRGPSGSGKSTLLNVIGAALPPDAGWVKIAGHRLPFHDERRLDEVRRTRLGYVFQYFNLLHGLTALENVVVPLLLNGVPVDQAERDAHELLERLGLAQRAEHFPSELSGGEMQRVAIGRAVIHRPPLVLADEPTGNLDSASGRVVLDLLRELTSNGTAVVMASHSHEALAVCDRVLALRDGALQ